MNPQGSKHIQSFCQLANQTNSLLSLKQLEQIDTLLQKSILSLAMGEADKPAYVKLLTSFFKLFLLCPFANTEMFYKKYYAILKQGFQSKSKNPIQEKYECLIVTLFDTADKYFSTLFYEVKSKNDSLSLEERNQCLLNVNIKGGVNLKGFVALLRKFIERDRDNSKLNEVFMTLKDIFMKVLSDFGEDLKKTNKICELYSFKFYFFNALFEQLSLKFQQQCSLFVSQCLKAVSFRSDQISSLKNIIFLQFLAINQQKVQFSQIFNGKSNESNQSSSWHSKSKNPYLVDILSGLLIIKGIHFHISEGLSNYLVQYIMFLRRRYKSLGSKLEYCLNCKQRIEELIRDTGEKLLENFVMEVFLKLKVHVHSFQYSKNLPASITETVIYTQNLLFNSELELEQKTDSKYNLGLSAVLKAALNSQKLSFRAKNYFLLLYVQVNCNQSSEYIRLITIQREIFEQFKLIQEKEKKVNFQEKRQFYSELYDFIGYKHIKQEYLKQIFGSQMRDAKENNIFIQIEELLKSKNSGEMLEQKQISQFLEQSQKRLKQQKYTLQDIVQCISNIFQYKDTVIGEKQNNKDPQFNQLSIILFDKMNIRPRTLNTEPKQLSFSDEKKKWHHKFVCQLISCLYAKDKVIRSNNHLMSSFPIAQHQNQEKIIVIVLRKYFGVFFNRINEFVIKKWVVDRDYSTIWSLLLCNYKVKTISDQLSRSGISPEQLQSFFKVDLKIIKQFIEYITTKDKYKFRLSLCMSHLTNLSHLLDYSLPELILFQQ